MLFSSIFDHLETGDVPLEMLEYAFRVPSLQLLFSPPQLSPLLEVGNAHE